MSKRLSIGRADARSADILLSGGTISAKHAEIYIDDRGSLMINDLGSSNGTEIIRHGQTLKVSSITVSLLPSDIVSLGGKNFSVDDLLSKQSQASVSQKAVLLNKKSNISGRKMIRCTSCGSVTPQGSACVECAHIG
jgi:pSer/pThr/pTyr-binding forkhead associated (FHA) protein